ncbi:MAG: gas vesicle protein K [Bacillota bacterium]
MEEDNQLIYEEINTQTDHIKNNFANRINADKEKVEQGLAKLVLTLVELLRRLLERQAMIRIDNDSLTDEEIEELGLTFMKLEEKMEELKEIFELQDEDLNIDLGPLGNLM